jgi:hypothetical protein
MITHMKVLIECGVVVLPNMFHCLLHILFEFDGRAFTPLGELFIIQLDINISTN